MRIFAVLIMVLFVDLVEAQTVSRVRQAGPATGLTVGDWNPIPPSCSGAGFDYFPNNLTGRINGGAWTYTSDGSQAFINGYTDECSHLNGTGDSGWIIEYGTTCEFISGPNNGALGLVGQNGTSWDCLADAPCDGYDQNWWDQDLDTGNGQFCTPLYNEDDNECTNVQGYIGDQDQNIQVCIDDQVDCEANGGTYGFFGVGEDAQAVCIPSDYASDIPDCDQSTVVTVDSGPGSYAFACSSPVSPPLEGDPTENPYTENDTDGDGIPDNDDPDIDGDGIPNGSDPDIDGDGVPNADDGDQTGSLGTVSGGGSCTSRPRCSGDAIQCAIVYQAWESRCATERGLSSVNSNLGGIRSELGAVNTNLGAIGDALTDTGDQDWTPIADQLPTETLSEDIDTSGWFDDLFSVTGAAGSCPTPPDLNFSLIGNVAASYQPLCDLASTIRPFVILLFGLSATRIVLRAFG